MESFINQVDRIRRRFESVIFWVLDRLITQKKTLIGSNVIKIIESDYLFEIKNF